MGVRARRRAWLAAAGPVGSPPGDLSGLGLGLGLPRLGGSLPGAPRPARLPIDVVCVCSEGRSMPLLVAIETVVRRFGSFVSPLACRRCAKRRDQHHARVTDDLLVVEQPPRRRPVRPACHPCTTKGDLLPRAPTAAHSREKTLHRRSSSFRAGRNPPTPPVDPGLA